MDRGAWRATAQGVEKETQLALHNKLLDLCVCFSVMSDSLWPHGL